MDVWADGWIDGEVDDSLLGCSRTSDSHPEGYRVEIQQLSSSCTPPIRTSGPVLPEEGSSSRGGILRPFSPQLFPPRETKQLWTLPF